MALAEFHHKVLYPDNEGIKLVDISDFLLAHDRVIRILPLVLEKAIDGLKIENIEIQLVQAETGSLASEFLVLVWTTYQTNIQDRVIGAVEALTGTSVEPELKGLITLLILALVFWGAKWVYKRINIKDQGNCITQEYNNILMITANNLNITPEKLEEIIKNATKGPTRRAIGKAAQRFFKPAQRNGIGRVQVDHYGEISRDTVAQVPTEADIEIADDDTDTRHLPKVKIHLRAYDLDQRERGWYGIIEDEEFSQKRLPVYLYPTINPETLKGKTEIVADVVLEQNRDDNGELQPRKVHILTIYDQSKSKRKQSPSKPRSAGTPRARRVPQPTVRKRRP